MLLNSVTSLFGSVGHRICVNMGPAKDTHGGRESSTKVTYLFAKHDRYRRKEFSSEPTYTYIYIEIYRVFYLHMYVCVLFQFIYVEHIL